MQITFERAHLFILPAICCFRWKTQTAKRQQNKTQTRRGRRVFTPVDGTYQISFHHICIHILTRTRAHTQRKEREKPNHTPMMSSIRQCYTNIFQREKHQRRSLKHKQGRVQENYLSLAKMFIPLTVHQIHMHCWDNVNVPH